jgi:hypothetical protein
MSCAWRPNLEFVVKGSFEDRKYDNSHESLIMSHTATEDSGERFPDIIGSQVV